MLVDPQSSCLLLVDIQERLLPAMTDGEAVVRNAVILAKSAARLGIPVLVSEQYPRGLGRTMPAVAEVAPQDGRFEKTEFSCLRNDAFRRRFRELRRPQPIVLGIETHVCVLQTAFDLVKEGCDTIVVADGVASRTAANRELALQRMARGRVEIASTEMVLFEWLGRAGTPDFKELSPLIR
jgi:nicotinamidase-related amidase